jgi:hypothetical protein
VNQEKIRTAEMTEDLGSSPVILAHSLPHVKKSFAVVAFRTVPLQWPDRRKQHLPEAKKPK